MAQRLSFSPTILVDLAVLDGHAASDASRALLNKRTADHLWPWFKHP
jgi:hypothetical protein